MVLPCLLGGELEALVVVAVVEVPLRELHHEVKALPQRTKLGRSNLSEGAGEKKRKVVF